MKRLQLIPITVLVLASLACSFFSKSTPAETPKIIPTKPQPVVVNTKEAIPTIPVPTETVELPTATTEVLATATEAPTETPAGPVEYVDTFDHKQGNWSDDFVVTSQSSGRDLYSKTIVQDGVMRFAFDDKETYMYKFFQIPIDGGVSIEASYAASGHLDNGIALVCKVNEDQTSWFEVRVSSNSDYSIYLYDKARKTEQGKNPYLQLEKGKLKIDQLYPTKPNIIKLTCLENELVFDANNGKRMINLPLDTRLDGSGVGLGAMSYGVVPIRIDFDQVTIREER